MFKSYHPQVPIPLQCRTSYQRSLPRESCLHILHSPSGIRRTLSCALSRQGKRGFEFSYCNQRSVIELELDSNPPQGLDMGVVILDSYFPWVPLDSRPPLLVSLYKPRRHAP